MYTLHCASDAHIVARTYRLQLASEKRPKAAAMLSMRSVSKMITCGNDVELQPPRYLQHAWILKKKMPTTHAETHCSKYT
jgi:hypothetical protein